ncbi:hypothetical protein ACP4OV_011703 [Aristida adscensionis]
MLSKASGGAGAASPMGCDPPPPPPPTSKLAAHAGNGGGPASRLLSPRGLFSVDAASAMNPGSMAELSKNPPCSGARNPRGGGGGGGGGGGIGGRAAGLAGVLVAGEADGGEGVGKNGRVLLGMRLRVQLPPPGKGRGAGGEPPGSPIEFGVKNRDAQLALLSPVQRSPLSSAARRSEVELAEDYTCVIARGPRPRMTHIFEDRVVESPAGAGDAGGAGGGACCLLSSCGGCKKDPLLLHSRQELVLQQPISPRRGALW